MTPMRSVMKKAAVREIKGSFGRYFAILAIIALGVGFFSGVRITTPAMVNTIGGFLEDHQFYDYRLISSSEPKYLSGWSAEDVRELAAMEDVRAAEPAYSLDAIYNYKGGRENVLKTLSITENVNTLEIVSGRMPESPDECVIDAELNTIPPLGSQITLSDENENDIKSSLSNTSFTVVGTVYSPLYVNFERGTTSIGNGSIRGFVYMQPEAFKMDRYTEIYIRFDHDYQIYSQEYKDYMKARLETWEKYTADQAEKSSSAMAAEMNIPAPPAPTSFVLDRNYNIGYACFESDSEIVEQVARIFPLFFILVAALVCMTTMSRMIEDQRTQIGIFKAIGYSNGSIMGRYLFYSGSAALIGCIAGYAVGIFLFPGVIWMTYKLMYINIPMRFIFDPVLAGGAVAASLLCSMGVTWLSCRHELSGTSASLMRPKSPKAGKRVLLEHIPFVWNKMKFLHKVSVRNIFRYKKRFFMMIVGISGCTALLLTGFGLKDSISYFADMQYGEIITADATMTYTLDKEVDVQQIITDELENRSSGYVLVNSTNWDLLYDDKVKSITLIQPESYNKMTQFMNFRDMDGKDIAPPEINEAIVSNSVQERYGADIGDIITLRDSSLHEINVKVVGVFENHVYNYVFIAPGTIENQTFNCAYFNFKNKDTSDDFTALVKTPGVSSVILFKEMRERMANMMSSLNYIVLLIIFSAAGLAFVVIYNLTNINITERLREIATIKVLGFFRRETSAYVLRENLALTAIGTALGLGLGVLLHKFVMAQIVVDLVSFRTEITLMSFILSAVLTFVFNFIVNLFMEIKLEKINMAESLKSVD